MNISVAQKMEKLNWEVKEVDEKSACIRTTLVTLSSDAWRSAM